MDTENLVVKFCVIQKLPSDHQGPKHLELRGRLPLGDVLCGEGFYEFEDIPAGRLPMGRPPNKIAMKRGAKRPAAKRVSKRKPRD